MFGAEIVMKEEAEAETDSPNGKWEATSSLGSFPWFHAIAPSVFMRSEVSLRPHRPN